MMTVHASQARQQIAAKFHSPDLACWWMRGVNGPHRLEVPLSKELNFSHQGTHFHNVSMGTIEYATKVHISIADLSNSYSISLPLQGTQSIALKGDEFGSNTEMAAIISPGQSLTLSMDDQCQKRLVRISRQAIESKLAQLLHQDVSAPIIFDSRMPLAGATREWWRMATTLQEMLQAEASLCDLPDVWSNFENSMITSLLHTQPHNYSSQLEERMAGRPGYLKELEAFFKNSLERSLTLADLEHRTGVSRERLYRDFHIHFGLSPIAYFRRLRFENVRKRLQQPAPGESVSSIAMDCGFQQLGRFSKEYRSRFGELPSQTLKP